MLLQGIRGGRLCAWLLLGTRGKWGLVRDCGEDQLPWGGPHMHACCEHGARGAVCTYC